MTEFTAYRRSDGRIGIRNHVLILPASVCASDTASFIAAKVEGCVTFHNQSGCAQAAADDAWTMEILSGYAANPNVYGTVVVSLGCEGCQMDRVTAEIRKKTNKPLREVVIQEAGGTLKAVELGVRYAQELVDEASKAEKVRADLSDLILGTECGGSDPTSGLAANPVIGLVSDRVVDAGGTSILSETTEFIGAEHILARRAKDAATGERILEIVRRYERALALVGEDVRSGNPTPGNKAGGITTLEEKSLGCIYKGGHRPVQAVYDYAKTVDAKGLVIMDTPGNDPASIAGMVAGGAQLIVFSTGRGTPTGHPIVPVIKITGNPATYARMSDNIDFDAGGAVTGERGLEELAEALLEFMVRTADGQKTKAEELGFMETAMARVCNYV